MGAISELPQDDSPEDDHEVESYSPDLPGAKVSRHFTREDADSLVGGTKVELPHADPTKTTQEQPGNFDANKVFSFSLPFGGLLLFRTGFKLPFKKEDDPEIEEIRLRLERKELLNTVDGAKYFSRTRGTDDAHFRAVKASIKENLSDFLPDFIHQKKEKPWEAAYNEIDGPVVVMGGYRGSILRDTKTGKRVWIPLKAGLNLRKINLMLGPTAEDEARAADLIYADGVLKNVGPIDICKKLIKKLDANPKTTVREFGYDWRLSLSITSGHLIECLEELRKETGKPTLVIAHSMGGLVAHGAMQKRPDLFRGIVYVGVPSECLNILGPLRYGDLVMFSDRILTFETNFMMRSLFAFLPLTGRVFSDAETGEWYDLDYFDPDIWVKYNLNPLVLERRRLQEEKERSVSSETLVEELSPSVTSSSPMSSINSRIKQLKPPINRRNKPAVLTNLQMQKRYQNRVVNGPKSSPRPVSPTNADPLADYNFSYTFTEAYNYLSETLKKTKEYVLGLNFRPELEHKYPPLAVVYGNTVPSVRGSNVQGLEDIRNGDYYEFYYGQGDGVVHQKWLMPEQKGFTFFDKEKGTGQIVGKFDSDCGHVGLMTDFKVMGEAIDAILQAEKHWKRELN